MRKTNFTNQDLLQPIAVDINGLMKMLSCGEQTAREIAKASKAQIQTNGKRALYAVSKIMDYIESNCH